MRFSVATWNINSVRLRLPIVRYFLKKYAPDVLCLQETKCTDEQFPYKAIRRLGYEHIGVHGQKGYHGVAVISKHPFSKIGRDNFCGRQDARHISVVFDGDAGLAQPLALHNFYIPAGGDEPNPAVNLKFAHKLEFLDELKTYAACRDSIGGARSIVVGDLNVAPLEHDVWSHKQMLRVVSHTPIEIDKFGALQRAGGWIDVMRGFVPEPAKLYTWWSYRARDWAASDRGRRLDHMWSSADLSAHLTRVEVLREARGHAYMLIDQEATRRVTERSQPGACLHCHASVIPAYRFAGDGDVMEGFRKVSAMPYHEARNLVDDKGEALIELGRTSMKVQDVLHLGRGSVIELDRMAGEPVDVYVGDRRFAEGEVVVLGENFGVRITRILPASPAATF